jgi:hypothetical protein
MSHQRFTATEGAVQGFPLKADRVSSHSITYVGFSSCEYEPRSGELSRWLPGITG